MRRSPHTQTLSPFSFISTPKRIGGSIIVGHGPAPERSPAVGSKRRVSAPRPLQGSKLGSGAGGRLRQRKISSSVNERQLIGLGILQDSPALRLNEPSSAVDARVGDSQIKGRKMIGSSATKSKSGKHAHDKENGVGRENRQTVPSTPQKSTKQQVDGTLSPKSPHIKFTSPIKPPRSPPVPVLKKHKSRRLLKSKPAQGMFISFCPRDLSS